MKKLFLSIAICTATPSAMLAQVPTTQAAPADRIEDALTLLNAGKSGEAIEVTNEIERTLRLAKAKPSDPALVNALHIRGIAQYRLGQFRPAAVSMQRTANFAGGNRSILINLALSDLKDPSLLPRSIKNLQAFATANPTDEDVVDLWGAAISKLRAINKVSEAKAKEWDAAYTLVDVQLEQTRPGFHRWGSEWITHKEHAEQEAKLDRAKRSAADAKSRVARAESALKSAQEDLNKAWAINLGENENGWEMQRRREKRDAEIAKAQEAIRLAKLQLADAKAGVATTQEAPPMPTWIAPTQMVDPILVE